MFNKLSLLSLTGVAGAVLLVGCGQKQEPSTSTETSRELPKTQTTQSVAQPAINPVVEQVRNMAENAQNAVSQAATEAQSLIDQTKSYLSESNYTAAAGNLEKLAGMSLTSEQQEMVAELKVEAGKAGTAVQGELSELKALVDEQKYQEASAKLTEFANVPLSSEQQQLLDKLRQEIQKGLAGQAAESGKKALGNLLKTK